MMMTILLFPFSFAFPPHTTKNQIIIVDLVVYIIIVGYVGYHFPCLLAGWLLPHFFFSLSSLCLFAVRFSLHALPDTRRPGSSWSEEKRYGKHGCCVCVLENHTNSLRRGRQKRFSLLTAIARARTAMRRCTATYTPK